MAATDQAVALARVAAAAAEDRLAQDVVVFDVSDQFLYADCFVIASATNERQVQAIVERVEEKLREHGVKPGWREGTKDGGWVLLNYVDIVVHAFHTEQRDFYGLDRLWKDSPRVELPADAVDDPRRA